MAIKQEPKKAEWKGETEEERIHSFLIWSTLKNIETRFGQNMIPIEVNILDEVMESTQIILPKEPEEDK